MGLSFIVEGVKLPDEKWKKMKKAYEACVEAGIEPPDEVVNYFNGDAPDSDGVVIDIDYEDVGDVGGRYTYEVKVADIPKDVSIVRFVISY